MTEPSDERDDTSTAWHGRAAKSVIFDPKLAQSIASVALPSIRESAGIRLLASNAGFQNAAAVTGLADILQKSIAANFPNGILAKSISANILQTSAIMPQLEKTLATFVPQHAMLSTIYSAQPGHSEIFRNQIGQLLSAQSSISRLIAGTGYDTSFAKMFESVSRYGQVNAQLAAVTIRSDMAPLLRGNTTYSGRLYDSYLAGLPARPIARRAAVAQHAGDTQTGLLIAESLTAPSYNTDEREDLADQLDRAVLEPWQTGPSQARTDLFEVLGDLDTELPDWLKAAWDDIVRDGPKAASKIANCTVECIDRALRVAAPSRDVSDWLRTIPAKQGYLADGKPTRRAKVMYIMRDRADRDAKLAAAQVDALASLVQEVVQNLQSVKHGEAPSIATMRSWVLVAEGALSQLFLPV